MWRTTSAAITCVMLAVTSNVTAQNTRFIYGMGNVPCGEFLEDIRQGQFEQLYTQWVAGYISAHNVYSKGEQIHVPLDSTTKAYLSKYCRDNPLKEILSGTIKLMSELRSKR